MDRLPRLCHHRRCNLTDGDPVMLDSETLEIPCPECGEKARKSIAWLKSNRQFTCAGCGSTINLQAEGLLAGIEEVEKAIADLGKTLGGIGKITKRR